MLGADAEDPIPELDAAALKQQRMDVDAAAGTGGMNDLLDRMTAKER
jgi:hypothetical protein